MNGDQFDFPGLIRLGQHDGEVDTYVRYWLGPVLDADAEDGSQLVATLRAYLDCWGDYLKAARVLEIHTSTTRYRVHRIRQVLAADLSDRHAQFNLQVATHLLGYVERGRQLQR
ncbi:PucR family transcriptional regulator [Pseudonocardia bannensis]|uniref:PucR family transcriptional regulator n=1 Tax=Pseudonocardia bannensis TaxID=630973 RepID=A0A848DMZ6_9PSEU|nr:helix-turn-helix domain-containing protein [Pseudonocardia bannensis]NMH94122.1 PucR family transcriptional regulator [Pseudonocardia bannensis]